MPVLAGNAKRTTCGNHVLDELLCNRHIRLSRDRRARSIGLLQVFAARSRDSCQPCRSATRDRHKAAPTQCCGRNTMRVAIHASLRASISDPAQDPELPLIQSPSMCHSALLHVVTTHAITSVSGTSVGPQDRRAEEIADDSSSSRIMGYTTVGVRSGVVRAVASAS